MTRPQGVPTSNEDGSITDRYDVDPYTSTAENISRHVLLLARDIDSANRKLAAAELRDVRHLELLGSIDGNLERLVRISEAEAERKARLEVAQLEAQTQIRLARGGTTVKVLKIILGAVVAIAAPLVGWLIGKAGK